MIREIQSDDYAAAARFWRELLDVPSATDESVRKTFEKMSCDDRYCTYVAVEDGIVVGFITLVEVLSIDDPEGYIKMNGIAVSPEYQHRGLRNSLSRARKDGSRTRGVFHRSRIELQAHGVASVAR